jgi:hypothetical protein
MKPRLMLAIRLVILLCCAVPVLAQNRVDVILEGPWILFQDHNFLLADGSTGNVVIAMVPGVADENDDEAFHTLAISAGDGYLVENPAMYCVTFGAGADTCGKNVVPNGKTALDKDGYSAVEPLPVYAADTWGNTYASGKNVTALILPMPDSYSNDGVYRMRFAAAFNVHGTGYKDREASIGIQLHYGNGPSDFNLFSCVSPKAADCKTVPTVSTDHTKLKNTGTLQIVMKAPDNNDPCDFHVRKAYPQLIKLLNSNKNANIAFIDPARHIDSSGTPDYPDDDDCLELDPQGPNGGNATMMHYKSSPEQPLPEQIGIIRQDLAKLSERLPLDEKKRIPLVAINAAALNLDAKFPKISQLARLQGLLSGTAKELDILSGKLMSQLSAQLDWRLNAQVFGQRTDKVEIQPTKEERQQLEELRELQQARSRIDEFMDDSGGKNGADCRAPVMQVQ